MGRKSPVFNPPTNTTLFREVERRFKRNAQDGFIELGSVDAPMIAPSVHCFRELPGVFLLKGRVSLTTQMQLVEQALAEWSRPPNLSNLDAHFELPDSGLWNAFVSDPASVVLPRIYQQKETHLHSNKLLIDPPTDAMAKKQPRDIAQVLMRLRWVTLGYQYNWTEKKYFFDRSPAFPTSVDAIVRDIVDEMAPFTGYPGSKYKSEAGIINFYHPGDSLTAHQDKSELNDIAPLVSCSIGLAAVFLIGTQSREDAPVAMKLESGDVVVMSGPARRNFHGVPCVLPGTLPAEWDDIDIQPELKEFMKVTRVNLNVRQVM